MVRSTSPPRRSQTRSKNASKWRTPENADSLNVTALADFLTQKGILTPLKFETFKVSYFFLNSREAFYAVASRRPQ